MITELYEEAVANACVVHGYDTAFLTDHAHFITSGIIKREYGTHIRELMSMWNNSAHGGVANMFALNQTFHNCPICQKTLDVQPHLS